MIFALRRTRPVPTTRSKRRCAPTEDGPDVRRRAASAAPLATALCAKLRKRAFAPTQVAKISPNSLRALRRGACVRLLTQLSAGLSTGDVDRPKAHARKRIARRKTSLTNARIRSWPSSRIRVGDDAEKPPGVKHFVWSFFRQNPCGPCCAWLCEGYTQHCPQACPQAVWIVARAATYCVAACIWRDVLLDEFDRIRSISMAACMCRRKPPRMRKSSDFAGHFFANPLALLAAHGSQSPRPDSVRRLVHRPCG